MKKVVDKIVNCEPCAQRRERLLQTVKTRKEQMYRHVNRLRSYWIQRQR